MTRADAPAQQAGGLFCADASAWGKPVAPAWKTIRAS